MPTARPEFWGHFEDDAHDSEKSEAEKNPLFYNIFRHTFNNQWDNTWKVNEKEKEGYGKKVSFWVHMNNTDDDLFLLGAFGLGVSLASHAGIPPPTTRSHRAEQGTARSWRPR